MAFFGDYFIYNGTPCTDFGLRLMEVGGESAGNGSFATSGETVEERISSQYKSLFYGVKYTEPLTFKMVFGLDKSSVAEGRYLTSWDKEAISNWLTPIDGYAWLEIVQEDMEHVRYRCRMEDLKLIEVGNMPVAFSCTVRCDSPFAYQYPKTYKYSCNGTINVLFRNLSSWGGLYYPDVRITVNSGNSVRIVNQSVTGVDVRFKNLPARRPLDIEMIGDCGVIATSKGENLYECSNFSFLGLAPGDNKLEITGDCTVELICEFPVSVGG